MFRKSLFGAMAALTFALLGLGFASKPASAEVTDNVRFPLVFKVDNPCEPGIDVITFTGWVHMLWYTTPDDTLIMRFNSHYTGTDSGGTEYLLVGHRTMEHWAWPSMAPLTDHIVIRLRSKGAESNATIELTLEYTTTLPPSPAPWPYVVGATCVG